MGEFKYSWRSKDGARHEDVVNASSRDEVFAMLRKRGIKPIVVESADWWSTRDNRGIKKPIVKVGGLIAIILLVIATGLAFFLGRESNEIDEEKVIATASGEVVLKKARALVRQEIFGDRSKIENFPTNLFNYNCEVTLARFAEPGRMLAVNLQPLNEVEVKKSLNEPIYVSSLDFTEYVDLKRIVVGLKNELKAYLDGGGTIADYQKALVNRQLDELSIRQKAEKELKDLIEKKSLEKAYDFWMRKNINLKSMGIWEMPLPEELKTFL